MFAKRATVAALDIMKRALAQFDMATKEEDLSGQLETTRLFYEQMLGGCGNKIIEEMLNTLTARITFLRSKSMSQPGRAQKSSREMKAIFRAIAAGDVEVAREAAVEHVRMACKAAMEKFLADQATPRNWPPRGRSKTSNS